MTHDQDRLRAVVYHQLEPSAWTKSGLSPVNWVVTILILVASLVAILESEPVVYRGSEHIFFAAEALFT